MGTALVTIKIMPENPQVNLKEIQKKAEQITVDNGGEKSATKTEPVGKCSI